MEYNLFTNGDMYIFVLQLNLNNMRIALLLILFLIKLSTYANDRNEYYYFRQIPLYDNISTSITDILYSKEKSIIWIGTTYGLVRYDGNFKKIYQKNRNSAISIPDNEIKKILEDKNGDVWVLTSEGIALYSHKNDNFTIQKYNNSPIKAESYCLIEDGIIFGATSCLYKYSYQNKSFEILFRFEDKYYIPHQIIQVSDREIICTNKWKGIICIDINSRSVKNNNIAKVSNYPISILKDSQNRIWVSDFNEGIKSFTSNGELLTHLTTDNSNLSNNIILCIKEINGKIWAGTDGGGINIINPKNNSIETLKKTSGDAYSLPDNTITCITYSDNNNIWAGSKKRGLINIKKVSMKTYSEILPDYQKGLSEKAVLSIFASKNDSILWIGTDGGGINSFNPKSERFNHFPNTWGDKVVSICEFTKDKLLISVFSKGFYTFDKHTGKKEVYKVNKKLEKSVIFSGKAVNLYNYKGDNILFLNNHIIYKLDIEKNHFDTISYEKGLTTGETLFFTYENDSILYLNDQHSIYALNKSNDSLCRILSVPYETRISSIDVSPNGTFWLGTNEGLQSWNPKSNKRITIKTSLFNKINSITSDLHGNIWIGAEQKLFVYIPPKEQFILFDESDGVGANELSQNASIKYNQEKIFIGGTNGLLSINTNIKNIDNQQNNPKINIIDFSINGENNIYRIKDNIVEIPWSSKNIRLRVIVNNGDILGNKIYKYNVNGSTYESFNPELFISSLPAGNYPITFSCGIKNNRFTEEKTLLTLVVTPPWYKSWWFVLICIILILSFTIILLSYLIRKKEEKLKWIMKEHEQKINEDKVRFLINISHELRTPLTLIHAPLNRIIRNMDKNNPIYQSLKKIYKQTDRMKEIINMVLDMRKMEMGYNSILRKRYDIGEWLEGMCEEFTDEAMVNNIKIELEKNDDISSFCFDRAKCTIILTNLLSNALKHSPENSKIKVYYELNNATNMVRITVCDEGVGLNGINTEKLFERFYQGENETGGSGIGLSYAKALVELHGGNIGAYSNKEKGSSFFFEIPYTQKEDITANDSQPKAYINDMLGNNSSTNIDITINKEDNDIKNTKVLFVDDNHNMTDFINEEMKLFYKEVKTCNSAKDALDLIISFKPDIIISDVMMPDMNGFELCKAIKQDIMISHIPVILLTAMTDEASKNYGYKIGADAYLSKPFKTEELNNIIDSIIYNREKTKAHYKNFGIIPEPQNDTYSLADEKFLSKLNKIIEDNISSTELDINFICTEIGMSRTSFYNKLKVLTNMGGNEYINKLRMEKAIQLINLGKYTINDISVMVGFSTPRYFSTAFKQYTGVTPTQFKSNNSSK